MAQEREEAQEVIQDRENRFSNLADGFSNVQSQDGDNLRLPDIESLKSIHKPTPAEDKRRNSARHTGQVAAESDEAYARFKELEIIRLVIRDVEVAI